MRRAAAGVEGLNRAEVTQAMVNCLPTLMEEAEKRLEEQDAAPPKQEKED